MTRTSSRLKNCPRPQMATFSARRFRGRQFKFSKYLFMVITAVKSAILSEPETETWIRLFSHMHTWVSNICGVHRRSQRAMTWECSVMTLNADFSFYFPDMSRDCFHFVVVKVKAMAIFLVTYPGNKESKQDLV